MNQLQQDLMAAKALIDTPEKWLQGELCNVGCTKHCVMGAVAHFKGRWISRTDLNDLLAAALPAGWERRRPTQKHRLAVFNDHPSTAHADIMALFDRAIQKAGEGE